jgi:hypothetical protein
MYEVDEHDAVVEIDTVPQPSVGAPTPVVLSDEHTLVLAYYVGEGPASWDGTSVRAVGPKSGDQRVAVVTFARYAAFMFGPPNDEAFEGHPLAKRGLHPYGAFEVAHSSWIRRLERMNAVHPHHDFILILGDRDTVDRDREPATMAQGRNRFARGLRFFAAATEEANALGVPLRWQLQILRGVDHDPTRVVRTALDLLFQMPPNDELQRTRPPHAMEPRR